MEAVAQMPTVDVMPAIAMVVTTLLGVFGLVVKLLLDAVKHNVNARFEAQQAQLDAVVAELATERKENVRRTEDSFKRIDALKDKTHELEITVVRLESNKRV